MNDDQLVKEVEERLRGNRDYLQSWVRDRIKVRAIELAMDAFRSTFTSPTFDTREHFREQLEKALPELLEGRWRVELKSSEPGKILAEVHPLDPDILDVLCLELNLSF